MWDVKGLSLNQPWNAPFPRLQNEVLLCSEVCMNRSRALSFRVVGIAGLLGSLTLHSPAVRAEDGADAASVGAARNLAVDGVKLADSGDCAGAVVKLSQAEGLYHSQIVASRLGECEIQLGQIVEGTERLRRLLREPVPEHATPAQLSALARAKQVLDESTGKVANLQLSITGPKPDKTTVKINGAVVPAAGLGVAFPVNPGAADVEVSAEGYYAQTEHVTLSAGEKLEITVALRPEPPKPVPVNAEPSASQPTTTADASPPPLARSTATVEDREEPSYAPTYVAFILGAAGLGVGAWYGMSAKKDYDVLAPKCQNNVCPPGESGNLKDAQNKGTIATVGLGVGAGAILVGTILLLTTGGSDEPSDSASASVKPWFGVNELGVSGAF